MKVFCWFFWNYLSSSFLILNSSPRFCGTKIRWIVEKAPGKNKEWQLLGKHASPKCLAALCGINSRRLVRAAHGLLDHRFSCNGAVSQLQVEKRVLHLTSFDPISCSLSCTSHDGPRLEQKWLQSAGKWICICLGYIMAPQECFPTSYFENIRYQSTSRLRVVQFNPLRPKVQKIWSIQDSARIFDGYIGGQEFGAWWLWAVRARFQIMVHFWNCYIVWRFLLSQVMDAMKKISLVLLMMILKQMIHFIWGLNV